MSTDILDLPPIVAPVTEVLDAAPTPAPAETAVTVMRRTTLAELSAVERGIAKLKADHGATDYDINTPKGLQAAKDHRLAVREVRYQIPHTVKARKAELLAQDECRELSKALAADPAAPLHAREAAAAIADAAVVDAAVKAGMDAVYAACVPMPGPTLTLGKFSEFIAPLKIDAAGLEALGFTAVKVHNAKLYHDTDKAAMVAAMVKHLQGLAA